MANSAGNILGGVASGASAGSIVPGIGTAIGAGLGLINGIVGAIGSARNERKLMNELNRQNTDNESYYQRAMGDYLQRSDSQAAIGQLRDNLKDYTKRAENMAVITGQTPEAQAIAKQQATAAIGNTYSNLAAIGQRYKDVAEQTYRNRKAQLANQKLDILNGRAESGTNQMYNGMSELGTYGSTLLNGLSGWYGQATGAGGGITPNISATQNSSQINSPLYMPGTLLPTFLPKVNLTY